MRSILVVIFLIFWFWVNLSATLEALNSDAEVVSMAFHLRSKWKVLTTIYGFVRNFEYVRTSHLNGVCLQPWWQWWREPNWTLIRIDEQTHTQIRTKWMKLFALLVCECCWGQYTHIQNPDEQLNDQSKN